MATLQGPLPLSGAPNDALQGPLPWSSALVGALQRPAPWQFLRPGELIHRIAARWVFALCPGRALAGAAEAFFLVTALSVPPHWSGMIRSCLLVTLAVPFWP